jgi:trimeric autotransporter adhesin
LPNAGFTQTGRLSVNADDLIDLDADITLNANEANIDLRNRQNAANWLTNIGRLSLVARGAGDLQITNGRAILVDNLNSDQNLHFINTGVVDINSAQIIGDLHLNASDSIGLDALNLTGDLHVITPANLRVADAGIEVSGNMQIDSVNLTNTSGAGPVRLQSDLLNLHLRNFNAPIQLVAQVDELQLTNDASSDMQIELKDNATVGSINSGGDIFLASSGNLIAAQNQYTVAGTLSFSVGGDLQLASGGLSTSQHLVVDTESISTLNNGTLLLGGQSGDIRVNSNQALTFHARFQQLGIHYASTQALQIISDQNLELTALDVPNSQLIGLQINGLLTLPQAGISAASRLNIDAYDLLDNDRNLRFIAPQLAVRLNNAFGNNVWDLATQDLDVRMRGEANLTVNDSAGLKLMDLNNDGYAIEVENGNFGVNLTDGDLAVAAHIRTADLSADSVRAGIIDFALNGGNFTTTGPVNISSTNLVDANSAENFAIRLRITDTSSADRSITLGDNAKLLAVGGDILIHTRPQDTPKQASRKFIQSDTSEVNVYNNLADLPDGTVTINDKVVNAQSNQVVRNGRLLAIYTDVSPVPVETILDSRPDPQESTEPLLETDIAGPKASDQFVRVFGDCDELDPKNQYRCRIESALKVFLSHWLVGGEMPPKTELK